MSTGSFGGGFAEGFATARQNRQNRQKAAQAAAHQAFQENLESNKFQFEQQKHEYQKQKDAQAQDLNERKFQQEGKKNQSLEEFHKGQEAKMNQEIKKMAQGMNKEQLEMQHAYFATWSSLSPQQQTEKAREVLVNNAAASGFLPEEQAARLKNMPLAEFHLIARAGLGMSANALNLQKYENPNKDEKTPSGYQWKEDGKTLEAIPGGPASQSKQVSAEKAKFNTQVSQGLDALNKLDEGFGKGDFNASTMAAGSTPNFLNSLKSTNVQKYELLKMQASEMFGRLQSGGAINKDEEKRFLQMLPSFGDSPETAQYKLKQSRQYYMEAQKAMGGSKPAPAAPTTYKLPSGASIDEATIIERAKALGVPPEEAIAKIKALSAPVSTPQAPTSQLEAPPMGESQMIQGMSPMPVNMSGVRG